MRKERLSTGFSLGEEEAEIMDGIYRGKRV